MVGRLDRSAVRAPLRCFSASRRGYAEMEAIDPREAIVVNGYELVTSDEEKVGRIVGVREGFVIVENGLVRHHRHVVPAELTAVEEERGVVRTTVVKEIIRNAPEATDDGSFDEAAVNDYYGLSAAEARSWTSADAEQERMVRGGL